MVDFFTLLRAISTKLRNALFTASESGKNSATSGESTTTLSPGRNVWHTCRAPLAKVVLGEQVWVALSSGCLFHDPSSRGGSLPAH